jgi:hypothetical protein
LSFPGQRVACPQPSEELPSGQCEEHIEEVYIGPPQKNTKIKIEKKLISEEVG